MVQGVSGNKRFLVIFQDRCDKVLNLNQINVMTVDRVPVIKEAEVKNISQIPDDEVDLENGYYHGVYGLLQFIRKGVVDRNEEQIDIEADPNEEEMEDTRIDNEIEHQWRGRFEENKRGLDNEKAILHAKSCYIYMNEVL